MSFLIIIIIFVRIADYAQNYIKVKQRAHILKHYAIL